MKRLLLMFGFQLLFAVPVAAIAGAVAFGGSAGATRALFLLVLPLAILAGTAVGWVKGRPAGGPSDEAPGKQAVRGLLGAVVGLFPLSNVFWALCLPYYYVLSRAADGGPGFQAFMGGFERYSAVGLVIALAIGYFIARR